MTDQRQSTPRIDRPRLPTDYGVPADDSGALPWSWATDRLTAAKNYWVSTTGANGQPHATPVWGVWVDASFFFDGSPETRRGRTLATNPRISVHLESGDEVVMLEGIAQDAAAPPSGLAETLVAAYTAKYQQHGYVPTVDQWESGGLWRVRPRLAFAWSEFPRTMTRYRFS